MLLNDKELKLAMMIRNVSLENQCLFLLLTVSTDNESYSCCCSYVSVTTVVRKRHKKKWSDITCKSNIPAYVQRVPTCFFGVAQVGSKSLLCVTQC